MNGLKDHCHCGHAKETHHEKRFNCAATYCECRKYQLYSDPYVNETPTERNIPAAPAAFDPYDPVGWSPDDDNGPPSTWPIIPVVPKWP